MFKIKNSKKWTILQEFVNKGYNGRSNEMKYGEHPQQSQGFRLIFVRSAGL